MTSPTLLSPIFSIDSEEFTNYQEEVRKYPPPLVVVSARNALTLPHPHPLPSF